MDHTADFDVAAGERIVYVRSVPVTEIPEEIRERVGHVEHMYALHNINGERLALVRDRNMAFVLARENEITAVSVH
ncbi:uncharacterized protein DUF1150 [Rhodobacter viridis]|uniref:Uncharacterized protein DUF1150 n=1 Tax=Rhodobacter viridis TaxID=1054202 RepID=A0A318TZT3_9RHOB|nr:DUF1150 family protein [Rhodobacter viridis]PYF09227.1 uncharacterized protein DUF1150 [Rhodobacter viridis]